MSISIKPYSINNNKTTNSTAVSFGGPNSQKTFKYLKSSKLIRQPNIFEKGADATTEGLARAIGSIASTSPVKKVTQMLDKSQNGMRHLISAVSIILTACTMKNIFKSKKIEEDQKLPLMLNELLTTATTVSAGYIIDKKLDKGYQKFVDTFMHVNKDLVKQDPKVWENGLKYAKTIVIMGFIYRYLGPVAVTPIANKISNIIVSKRQKDKKPEEQPNTTKA